MKWLHTLLLAGLTLPALADVPARWERAWPDTDFTRISVDPGEIFSGGPPRDGIPAIDDPEMVAVGDTALPDAEPVMSLALPGQPARAYPVRYLMWHEIVNDRAGDVPVAVTFCPLCNSGLIFDRRIGGRELVFGVSGMLRHSDMVMFDRQTDSWWQQFTGEAIVGEMLGEVLTPLPALLESWGSFRGRHPGGLVMAEPAAHARNYGANPYRAYDSGRPFLYRGEDPPHGIAPLARVIRVGDRAWPMARVAGGEALVEDGVRLVWEAGQASALDTARIAEGRDVGTIRAFDADTGAPLVHEVVFAFAFHAFTPEGRWMLEPEGGGN